MPITFDEKDSLSIFDPATSGGDSFTEDRGTPNALIGFDVRHAALIDAVTPIYAELRDDGTLGEEKTGSRYGGLGGQPTRLLKPGYVVVGLDCRQGQFEDNMAVIWQKWTPAGPDNSDEDKSDVVGGPGGRPLKMSAKPGHVAIGIHGRSGGLVDRLSLITAKPVLT